tara:strand:- start:567 stop:2519 length:1953 start_codon:yes stop_codon:yes gene_type:complete
MSVGTKLLQAAAGNAGEAVYVDDVFSCFLHVGDSSSGRSINNGIDLDGEGGLVWIKGRSSAYNNVLYDTARGATQEMYSNNADRSAANTNALTAFNSNGFTIGSAGEVNANLETYVSWTFRKQEKFFDIVSYTGNGTAGRTLSHNLDSVPGMIIIKRTDGLPTAGDWIVWHRAIRSSSPENYYVKLNSNAGEVFGSYFDGGSYSNVLPTSTEITLGDTSAVNASGGTYVMYLFAHNEQEFGENSDEAIIHCGSYTGTGSDLSIDLGFEPQWILFKKSNGAMDWVIRDNMRGTTDGFRSELYPNLADAEYNHASGTVAFTSTGFRLPIQNGYYNTSGDTFIYVAIRRPNKPASEFAATDLFGIDTLGSTGDGAEPGFRSTFPCDTGIRLDTDAASTELTSRLTQGKWMYTDQDSAEGTANFAQFDYQNGWGASTSTASNYYGYMFRRAKGFFDVVAYTGNSTNGRTVTHNLGAVPEMMWVKQRGQAENWMVYHSALGNTKVIRLNTNGAGYTDNKWNDTTPTSTVFSLDNSNIVNGSGRTYIAYLFASVTGISKVGSYTGTGSDLNVDCGFSAGAKFVLIKRTDGSGDWYLYDSARGIVAGNDPYKLLNSNAAQVTNTDYIDPLSAGFTVTSSAPAGLNASSGNYIFLAIA